MLRQPNGYDSAVWRTGTEVFHSASAALLVPLRLSGYFEFCTIQA